MAQLIDLFQNAPPHIVLGAALLCATVAIGPVLIVIGLIIEARAKTAHTRAMRRRLAYLRRR
jgi:uncharacterized membrane protein